MSKTAEIPPVLPEAIEAPEGYTEERSMVDREPVRVSTGLSALVAALSVLTMKFFSFKLDADTQLAVVTVIAIVAPVVAGWWARRRVTPVN